MADGMMNKNHYSRTEKVKNCLPVITNLIKKEHGSIFFAVLILLILASGIDLLLKIILL